MRVMSHGLRGTDKRPTPLRPGRRSVSVVCEVAVERRGAVLCKRVQAHRAAVTAGVVISSTPGVHEVATAGLDKTVAYWQIHKDQDLGMAQVTGARIMLHGGPAFSLLPDTEWAKKDMPVVFCGTATQGIVSWDPLKDHSPPRVILPPFSGWVRSLDSHGKWMLSGDCNNLRLMDLSWTVPRHVADVSIDTGDILDLSVHDKTIFASTTDGSIHQWDITKGGSLTKSGCVNQAHKGRITAVLIHNNVVFSTGFDGTLKMWNGSSLECLAVASSPHSGKINALAMGADGLLHTGGDDGLIYRWLPKTLTVSGHPLVSHDKPIRVLSAGKDGTLLSGDASGLISIWDLCGLANQQHFID